MRDRIEHATHFEAELQLSPRPVLVILLCVGIAIFFTVQLLAYPLDVIHRVSSFLLLVEGLCVIGWLLTTWRPLVGRWFTIFAVAAVAHSLVYWLEVRGTLALAAAPVALAAPLIGLSAALLTAVCESAIVLVAVLHPVLHAEPADGIVALALIWIVFSAMAVSYRHLRQLSYWVEEYHDQAQRHLEEARDRKAELERALAAAAHANRQLKLANERTAALRTIAEEAQKAKTAFVARVSHEFRTPLNMIIGMIELMVERPDIYDIVPTPKMREDLLIVYENCKHLSHMIDDVLDLTRLEMGVLALQREWTDLREIIMSSVKTIRPLLVGKGLSMEINVPATLPPVYCDPVRVQQVILNLLSNAARFTERGGLTVEVLQRENDLLVTVADTGPGIAPEDLQRIFEPFRQGSKNVWRDKGGSGLGLAISRQFVRLHGGQLWAESRVGEGSRFMFTLPLALPVEHIIRPGRQIREDWVWREPAFRSERQFVPSDSKQHRVLVYDESRELCAIVNRYQWDFECVEVHDWAHLRRELAYCPAHAIIVNVTSSADLCPRVMQAAREAVHTPVIGWSVSGVVKQAFDAGVVKYLVKPVTRAVLQAAIEGLGRRIRRVLVVDDDVHALELFTRMLMACDETLDVVTASNGAEALERLYRDQPDLLLLDLVMPGMDGWQILDAIQRDARLPKVPTFIVSARDPCEQPPTSPMLVATMGTGISLGHLLRCSLEISRLLLTPVTVPDLKLG